MSRARFVGRRRHYYDPGAAPRPENHARRAAARQPRDAATPRDLARLERATAKRQRRARRRADSS